jgi:hypothetical protein
MIIEWLILELFSGQLVERHIIIERVRETHLMRGGSAPRVQDFSRAVKKALSDMRSRGLAQNPSFGYWRIESTAEADSIAEGEGDTDTITEKVNISEVNGAHPIPDVERTLGQGSGAVYVYYLPTYRQLAEHRKEDLWPCKVGRTERDPLTRVLAQAATALPERPVIALVVYTAEPQALESALHGILIVRGRQVTSSPGSEWFLTSPAEVEELVHFITYAPECREDELNEAVNDF